MRAVFRGFLAMVLLATGMLGSVGCSKDETQDPEYKAKIPEVPPVSRDAGKKAPEKK